MLKMKNKSPGSPPHTRGKAVDEHFFGFRPRITPAHAGKSILLQSLSEAVEDHPRTRGEKQYPNAKPSTSEGSPPHTRGKVVGAFSDAALPGITPAHAGKSMFQITARRDLRDHPRTRGEKCSYPADRHSVPGSPPHTRGKVHPAEAEHRRSRITPAHAGKSSASCGLRSLTRDHPRTRGEKPLVQGHSFLLLGSPPHTRGKGSKTLQDRRLRRITPAHAGKRFENTTGSPFA